MMRLVRGEGPVQVCDLKEAAPDFHIDDQVGRAAAKVGRVNLLVPLRKDGTLLGVITANRWEAQPFSDKQIAHLENFAAQAVIAMENARLMTETREALEQQTATAEVLQVINSSPGDPAPVFDATLEKAMRLCEAVFGALYLYEGEHFRAAATQGVPEHVASLMRQPHRPPEFVTPLLEGEHLVHITDAVAIAGPVDPINYGSVELGDIRTLLVVPLRKDGALLGTISVFRQEVHPFSDKQIGLLQNFAAQV